jgi:hypothetical protein
MHIARGNAFGLVVGRLDFPSTGSRGQIDLLDAGTTSVPCCGEGVPGGHFSKEGELDYNSEVTLSNPKCLRPIIEKRIAGNSMSSIRRWSYKKETRQDSHELSEVSQQNLCNELSSDGKVVPSVCQCYHTP